MQRVDAAHEFQVVVVGRRSLATNAGARNSKHLALPANRQIGMLAIKLGSTVRRAHLPNHLAKKSLDRQLSDLGVELLDLLRRERIGVPRELHIECARCEILKLFLPGVQVRMNLMALRLIGHRRLLAQRLQSNLRLQRRINLPSRLGHVTLRSKAFGADFFKLTQWFQNRGPLHSQLAHKNSPISFHPKWATAALRQRRAALLGYVPRRSSKASHPTRCTTALGGSPATWALPS